MSRFEFELITLDDVASLEEWHEIYKTAFPHEDEQEPIERFRQIQAMNTDTRVQKAFGPYREYILAMRDTETPDRKIMGGLNIGVVSSDAHTSAGLGASVHVIFLFVSPAYRNKIPGIARKFKAEIAKSASDFILEHNLAGDVGIFFEVNNPLEISPEELLEDYANSGIDTYHRYVSWLEVGTPLDFPYVQPALSSEQSPVEFLHLFFDGPGRDESISAEMLRRHLYSFVSISVRKGVDAGDDPDFQKMDTLLKGVKKVGFLRSDEKDIEKIKSRDAARSKARRQRNARKVHAERLSDFPDVESHFSRPGWWIARGKWLLNLIYRMGRSIYVRLEPLHIAMAYVELLTLGFALATSVILITGNLGKDQKLAVDISDILLFTLLFVYLGTRMLVQRRRDRLGPSFRAVQAAMQKGMAVGAVEPSLGLLSEQLRARVKRLKSFGHPLGDCPVDSSGRPPAEGVDIATRNNRLFMLCRSAASAYSDRVWGVDDPGFADRELLRLSNALNPFREGLWCAKFETSDRFFFSLIVPIILPHNRALLDHETLKLDLQLAKLIEGQISRVESEANRDPPCLLVLRQLPGDRLRGERAAANFDRQLDLLLTTLLHLGEMLEKLSHGGDLVEGLERAVVLCVGSNKTSRWLLEVFGFRLLQSSASHQRHDLPEHGDRTHFSIYSLNVERGVRDIKTQQFLQLLSNLRQDYSEKINSAG